MIVAFVLIRRILGVEILHLQAAKSEEYYPQEFHSRWADPTSDPQKNSVVHKTHSAKVGLEEELMQLES